MVNVNNKYTDLLVVGGGIFGSAIAYYYKRDNPGKEVVVYERNELCSGNTSLAAALMSRVRAYGHVIPLSLETYRVIPELNKITGDTLPIQYNGAIHLAVKPENVAGLEEMLITAASFGIGYEYITPSQATQKVPWLTASMAEKIAFIPGEAITDPYLLGTAFAKAATALGVKFVRHTEVLEILKEARAVTGIRTKHGIHLAETTVLAAGVWSTQLAYEIGIAIPMAAVRSQYWITETSAKLFPSNSPTVLIPEANFYSRPQGNSLLFGIREANSMYADPRTLPGDIHNYTFSKDKGWHDLEENFGKLLPFFPGFTDIGIKNYVAGFSGYTPDNQFILGEVPGTEGLLLATGCVGVGISVAGGIGLGIASLAGKHENLFDFSHYKYDRFGIIDPYSKYHLEKCATARSKKTSG
ncbi:MAG: FAD-binding oxidoreductase [Lentimicrobiaceae bacterium]|jgi:4-methylaminobutanoate oxidase (formaldehyde-forming)